MEPQPDHFLAALADQLKSQDRGTVAERVMKRAVELTALREAAGTLSAALGRHINVDAYKQVGKLIEELLKACPTARTRIEGLWEIFRTQSTDLCLAAVRIQQLTEQLASCEKALAESHAREMAAKPVETSHTRAELAAAVDAAHALLHEGRTEEAHEALHGAGAGKERVGSATRDPEAQRIVGELMTKLEGTGLPCGHRLADLIGGQGAVTKCGACLVVQQVRKGNAVSAGDEFRMASAEQPETGEQYIARLRAEVEERRAALDEAMSRTSLYDHEQEMLENSEMELAEALEANTESKEQA